MVELSGTLSNPQARVEIFELAVFLKRLAARVKPKKGPATITLPRRRTPVLGTIIQVLQMADYEPMSVKDIHEAVEQLLGHHVDYRVVKNSLYENAHSHQPKIVRWQWGRYRLSPSHPSDQSSRPRSA